MFLIRGKFKNIENKSTWYISGLDSRPLKYTTYGIAERECTYYQQQNDVYVKQYGDEEVIYEVIEE